MDLLDRIKFIKFEREFKKNPYSLIETWLKDFPRLIGHYAASQEPLVSVVASEIRIFLYDIFDFGCKSNGLHSRHSEPAFSYTWENYWKTFSDLNYSDAVIESGFDIHYAAHVAIRKQEGFLKKEYLHRILDYQSTILSVFVESGDISMNNTPQCINNPLDMNMEIPGVLTKDSFFTNLMNGYMDKDALTDYLKVVRLYTDYFASIK